MSQRAFTKNLMTAYKEVEEAFPRIISARRTYLRIHPPRPEVRCLHKESISIEKGGSHLSIHKNESDHATQKMRSTKDMGLSR
jgi:hypothetical protein